MINLLTVKNLTVFVIVFFLFLAGCTTFDKTAVSTLKNETKENKNTIDADATKDITKRETERITQSDIAQITKQVTEDITKREIDRITKERTTQITEQIIGGRIAGSSGKLKEVKCDRTPTKRQFNDSFYYTGFLIDSHLHMPNAFKIPAVFAKQADYPGTVLEEDITAGDLICLFDKQGIKSVFGFYLVTNMLTESSISAAKLIEEQYPGRVIPFLMSPHLTSIDLKPDEVEKIISSKKNLFKGYGEIAMYRASYANAQPDEPFFLEIYKIADTHNLIVMIHPDDDNDHALERILRNNPGVIFLFHGGSASETAAGSNTVKIKPWVTTVLKYPNAYYTVDTDFADVAGDRTCCIYDLNSKEEFIPAFKKNYQKILNQAIATWKPVIEKYPDKILWGTDRAYPWHFDPEVSGLIEESSRSFIGQLDPSVQEKFAYKNADKLLNAR